MPPIIVSDHSHYSACPLRTQGFQDAARPHRARAQRACKRLDVATMMVALLALTSCQVRSSAQRTPASQRHCCISTPFEEAMVPRRRSSTSHATRSARANALNVASTM